MKERRVEVDHPPLCGSWDLLPEAWGPQPPLGPGKDGRAGGGAPGGGKGAGRTAQAHMVAEPAGEVGDSPRGGREVKTAAAGY